MHYRRLRTFFYKHFFKRNEKWELKCYSLYAIKHNKSFIKKRGSKKNRNVTQHTHSCRSKWFSTLFPSNSAIQFSWRNVCFICIKCIRYLLLYGCEQLIISWFYLIMDCNYWWKCITLKMKLKHTQKKMEKESHRKIYFFGIWEKHHVCIYKIKPPIIQI